VKKLKVKNPCADTSFVEFVRAQAAEEETEEEGDPFVFGTAHIITAVYVGIHICVGVCIVDDNAGLLGLGEVFCLTAAMCTDNCGLGNFSPAMFTEFCFLLSLDCGRFNMIVHKLTLFLLPYAKHWVEY